MDQKHLLEQLQRLKADAEEPLHEDLKPHVTTLSSGMPMIHHPFVVGVLMGGTGHYNRLYQHKRDAAREALSKGDWESYVFIHERPYRFDALLEAIDNDAALTLSPETFWGLVGQVWTDSENIWQHVDGWEEVWQSDVEQRELAMDEDERAAFLALPDVVTVYRGTNCEEGQRGLSWTTDKTKAEWFARRFADLPGHQPFLLSGKVRREFIMAHFLGRNESEVVVIPENIETVEIKKLAKKRKVA